MKKLALLFLFGVMPAFGQTFNRSDGTLQNALGQALSGATVYVCTQPCSATPANPGQIPPSPLAAIFLDNAGTPTTTPGFVTTDGNGNFFFYSSLSVFTEVFVYRGRIVKVLPDQVPQGATAAILTANTVPATPIYATTGGTLTPDTNFGDSTGLGDLFANKSLSINGTGFVWTFKTQSAPPPPAAGFMEWYGDSSTNQWTCINPDGSNCGPGGAGSGTVTNFSAGTFAPLFTTTVATANSTPALSFTASTFAAHKFYGNNTGSTATPGAQSIGTADLGTGTANSSTFLRGDQTWATPPSGGTGSSLLNSSGPQSAITGTGAAATAYSFSIPGGTMSTTSCVRVTVLWQHSTGSASATYTWNYGTSAFASTATNTVGVSRSVLTVCNNGATNSQFINAFEDAHSGINAPFTSPQAGTSAIDSTASQTISFQFTVANTDVVTPKSWIVESIH